MNRERDGLAVVNGGAGAQRQQERLALVGQMTAGVIHDCRSSLGTAALAVEVAQQWMQHKPEQAARMLSRAQTAIQDIDQMVERLLDFSRGRRDVGIFEVAALVENVTSLMKPRLKKAKVETRVHCQPEQFVHGVPIELRQVLANLVMNACEAMSDQVGGCLSVDCRRQGDSVIITVEDTGPGIEADKLTRIFEAFYTTKEQGCGLGLWNCSRILAEHGGRLEVESELGRGTRFTVVLPRAAGAALEISA